MQESKLKDIQAYWRSRDGAKMTYWVELRTGTSAYVEEHILVLILGKAVTLIRMITLGEKTAVF